MLARMLSAEPLNVTGNAVREAETFDDSVTILDEQSEQFVPLAGHANLDAKMYPITTQGTVQPFDTARTYTDRVKLNGFYPRVNSSHYALVKKGKSPETVMMTILDIVWDAVARKTTLMCQRKGVDN